MEIKIDLRIKNLEFEALSAKCFEKEITVHKLISDFISDLICGENSGGSDERMYADQWFGRRYEFSGIAPEKRFKELYDEKLKILAEEWRELEQLGEFDEMDNTFHDYAEEKIRNEFHAEHGFSPVYLIDDWVGNYCRENDI